MILGWVLYVIDSDFFWPSHISALYKTRWHITCPWLVVIREIYLRQYWKCLYSLLYFSSLLSCACPGAFSESQFTRLEKMFNPAVGVVHLSRKFDRANALWRKLKWHFIQSLIQHQCLLILYWHYYRKCNILLNPPIQFGRKSHYEIRTVPYFALSFTQRFFLLKRDLRILDQILCLLRQMDIMASKSRHFSIF